jgi:hypothetical protein
MEISEQAKNYWTDDAPIARKALTIEAVELWCRAWNGGLDEKIDQRGTIYGRCGKWVLMHNARETVALDYGSPEAAAKEFAFVKSLD